MNHLYTKRSLILLQNGFVKFFKFHWMSLSGSIFYLGRLRGMGRDFGLGGFQDFSRKGGYGLKGMAELEC